MSSRKKSVSFHRTRTPVAARQPPHLVTGSRTPDAVMHEVSEHVYSHGRGMAVPWPWRGTYTLPAKALDSLHSAVIARDGRQELNWVNRVQLIVCSYIVHTSVTLIDAARFIDDVNRP